MTEIKDEQNPNYNLNRANQENSLQIISTARQQVGKYADELIQLIIEGGEVDAEIRPFLYAEEGNPFRETADDIVYMATHDDKGNAILRRVFDPAKRNGMTFDIEPMMTESRIRDFFAHVASGLFQLTDLAVANRAHKRLIAFSQVFSASVAKHQEYVREKKQAQEAVTRLKAQAGKK